MKSVIYQGVPGSFSHTTAVSHFGNDVEFKEALHFRDLFEAVAKGSADYGVVPVENTLAGSIYENYDHFATYDVTVVAEKILRVEHNLLVVPGTKIGEIEKVISHPKALEQCERFFETHKRIEEVAVFDTAGAAQRVAEEGNRATAAIASAVAAKMYGLEILQKNIEDDSNNYTRFFIITKHHADLTDVNKCSILFSADQTPGCLYTILQSFSEAHLNMTKIESRPIKGKPFEYFISVDFEFAASELKRAQTALESVRKHTQILKVLGFYTKDTTR